YARSSHRARHHKNDIIFSSEKKDYCLRLSSSLPLHIRDGDGYAEFSLKPTETVDFILENIQDDEMIVSECKEFVDKSFIKTCNYWKDWSAKSNYNGHWREMVMRSALVLKLLMSYEYGSIIAAPTFSLPELIGGKKNWDYRFAWVRDAAFTV